MTDSGLAGRLGAEVRRVRTERGLTLQQLGERSGLSFGYLSQVERGLSNPSFASLLRVAGALNLPMSALLPGPDTPAEQDEASEATGLPAPTNLEASVHPSGVYRDRFITPAGTRTIQVLESTLEPGDHSRVTPYVHAEEEELIFVIDGELEFRTGDRVHLLGNGDSLLVDPTIPHSYRNPGKASVRWLWISAIAQH